MAKVFKPMWWVLDKETERTIAICDKEDDANAIKELYGSYKNTECIVRVAIIG